MTKTFAHHASLPRLPVPALRDTLERYVASLAPFLSESELAASRALAEDFAKPGGEGEALQRVLLQRAKELPNWLEEWWEYAAYLSDRTPNALFINMLSGFGSFLDFDKPVSQARRAAETIRCEKVPVEKMGGRELCMNMFRRLFSSCRIPGSPVDTFERYDTSEIQHIMVFCEGRGFVLQVYDAESQLLTIGDLETQLVHILQHSKYLNALERHVDDDGRFLGALTAMRRDEWTSARQALVALSPVHADNLAKIQRSLFAVCLDSTTPPDPSALAKACAAGSCGNRWYDKSFQYVVFRNGMVGSNIEHANADATILQSMYRWLGERYLNRSGGYETFIESRHHSLEFLPPPERLQWRLSPALRATVAGAIARFEQEGDALRIVVIRNKKYGKAPLKRVGLVPDVFVQMGIQLAGFRLFGTWEPTYESGHTRMFLHGRTETIRTVTSEVAAWLAAVKANEPKAQVYAKLLAAMARHKELTIAALTGQGIDRHLLGLQVAALLSGKPLHPLYADPAYAKSGCGGHFVLSTSNVSGYPWLWGGFVPMVRHGIGVCYGAENDFLSFIISSFDEAPGATAAPGPKRPRVTAQQFQLALFASFDEIYALACEQRQVAKM
ncbi:hypothetical protein PybrP1_008179 [[Pythium] brassicae (nom. inval.)]|nr:hypothetical protein PybrP1_008179 [[Pythium] brassicae (nom. inval.)]